MPTRYLFLLLILAAAPAFAAGNSGLPVPRFVALKADEVNVRTGPGTRYPISWVYRREGMPVEVIEEFDYWRKVRDPEGTSGWIHKSLLSGARNAMIKGKKAHIVRLEPKDDARALLKVEPQVVTRLVECAPKWCRVQIAGRKGWIEKKLLWGVYDGEVFD